jgi:hypothetical protein
MANEQEHSTPQPTPISGKNERKAFALRLSAPMLTAIEKWAQDDFRSTNSQIEYLLNEALKKAGRGK